MCDVALVHMPVCMCVCVCVSGNLTGSLGPLSKTASVSVRFREEIECLQGGILQEADKSQRNQSEET